MIGASADLNEANRGRVRLAVIVLAPTRRRLIFAKSTSVIAACAELGECDLRRVCLMVIVVTTTDSLSVLRQRASEGRTNIDLHDPDPAPRIAVTFAVTFAVMLL